MADALRTSWFFGYAQGEQWDTRGRIRALSTSWPSSPHHPTRGTSVAPSAADLNLLLLRFVLWLQIVALACHHTHAVQMVQSGPCGKCHGEGYLLHFWVRLTGLPLRLCCSRVKLYREFLLTFVILFPRVYL